MSALGQKRTCAAQDAMSAMGQKRTFRHTVRQRPRPVGLHIFSPSFDVAQSGPPLSDNDVATPIPPGLSPTAEAFFGALYAIEFLGVPLLIGYFSLRAIVPRAHRRQMTIWFFIVVLIICGLGASIGTGTLSSLLGIKLDADEAKAFSEFGGGILVTLAFGSAALGLAFVIIRALTAKSGQRDVR